MSFALSQVSRQEWFHYIPAVTGTRISITVRHIPRHVDGNYPPAGFRDDFSGVWKTIKRCQNNFGKTLVTMPGTVVFRPISKPTAVDSGSDGEDPDDSDSAPSEGHPRSERGKARSPSQEFLEEDEFHDTDPVLDPEIVDPFAAQDAVERGRVSLDVELPFPMELDDDEDVDEEDVKKVEAYVAQLSFDTNPLP